MNLVVDKVNKHWKCCTAWRQCFE